MLKKFCFALTLITLPILASAQLTETAGILTKLKDIVTDTLIPIVFTLALLFFFYGVAMYIWSAGSDKEGSKKIMTWGIVALFVMSSVWGIIYFLRGELNINDSQSEMKIPKITP